MAIWQKEFGLAHGRGFSGADPLGFLAKLLNFMKRPAADGSKQAFTADAGTNNITCAGHGYVDGESVWVETTDTLPGGLTIETEFFVIYGDVNTFQLASTYQNAIDGTEIDITDAGTGTHQVYALGGGANWYIIADKSNPQSQAFTVDAGTEIVTCAGHGYGTGEQVWVTNSGGALPGGLSAGTRYYVSRIDANTFYFCGNQTNAFAANSINITSAGTGTHSVIALQRYVFLSDVESPVVNDIDTSPSGYPPKFMKICQDTLESGVIRIQGYMWYDSATNTPQGRCGGNYINTSDDNDFAYYFYGGAEGAFLISRIGTSFSKSYWLNWTGDANLIPGADKYGIVQSGLTAGTNVVIQLDTGEAANFEIGDYVFLFDFNGHEWVDCVKITNRDTGADTITVDAVTVNYPAGAVVTYYSHRWVFGGSTGGNVNLPDMQYQANAHCVLPMINAETPYCAAKRTSDAITAGAIINWSVFYCERAAPNRKGEWAFSEIGVAEYWRCNTLGNANAKELYGTINNLLISKTGSMATMQDGRKDQGKEYINTGDISSLFPQGYYSGGYSAMLLNDTSTT
jgi:hypothetical protein